MNENLNVASGRAAQVLRQIKLVNYYILFKNYYYFDLDNHLHQIQPEICKFSFFLKKFCFYLLIKNN